MALLVAVSPAEAQPGFSYTGLFPLPPFPGPARLVDIGCINYEVNPVNPELAGSFFHNTHPALFNFPEFYRACMLTPGTGFAAVEFNTPSLMNPQPRALDPHMVFGPLPWARDHAAEPGMVPGLFGGGTTAISGPTISVMLTDHPSSDATTASCMYASWSATFTSEVFAMPAVTPMTRFISVGGVLPPGSAVAFGLNTYIFWSDGTLQNLVRNLYVGVANDGRQIATLGPPPNPPLLDATVSLITRVPLPGGSVAWTAVVLDQTAATSAANIIPGTRYTAYSTFTALADPGATIQNQPLTQDFISQYRDYLDNAMLGNVDPFCPADFNRDHNIDPDDLGDFINCYFSLPPCDRADFNQDGDPNPDDLGDFINTFFSVNASEC